MTATNKSVNWGKSALNASAMLTPRQALGEHFVGIGADPEVMDRVEAGKAGEGEPADHDKQPMAPAKID